MTPQAKRAPAFPVLRLSSLPPFPKSSASWWIFKTHKFKSNSHLRMNHKDNDLYKKKLFLTTIVLPIIESGPLRVIMESVMLILAMPSIPAVTFPRSPTCLFRFKTKKIPVRTTHPPQTLSKMTIIRILSKEVQSYLHTVLSSMHCLPIPPGPPVHTPPPPTAHFLRTTGSSFLYMWYPNLKGVIYTLKSVSLSQIQEIAIQSYLDLPVFISRPTMVLVVGIVVRACTGATWWINME